MANSNPHDEAVLRAIVPGLVLEAIVKDPRLARNPRTRLVAHAKIAGGRGHEGVVEHKAMVGATRVRSNP